MLLTKNKYLFPFFLGFCFYSSIAFAQTPLDAVVPVPVLGSWADTIKQITATFVLAVFCYIFWKDNKELRATLLSVLQESIKENTASNKELVTAVNELKDVINGKIPRG